MRRPRFPGLLLLLAVAVAGCGTSVAPSPKATGPVQAIGAESQYASVIKAIGGPYVRVTAILSNPAADPHDFEASATDARQVAEAALIVQNGAGYDGFMNDLESAVASKGQIVITVGTALGLGPRVKNPHLWYEPGVMTKVAEFIARDLSYLRPANKAYFRRNLKSFDASLKPWLRTLAAIRANDRGAPVAVTEPVADDMLQAAGLNVVTPWSFQAAVMNGTDPSPEAASTVEADLSQGRVKVLVYNRQATDAATKAMLALARRSHIPVVGVYETMPPGMTYATWMEAEARAIEGALQGKRGGGQL